MYYIVRVSSNGRITIPIAIRRQLGIKPGDILDVRVEGQKIILRKVDPANSSSGNDRGSSNDKHQGD
jgi:AbrB family looped-hinge helix DNA binding protein